MMTDYLYGYDSDHAKVDTIAKGSIEGYPYIIRKWKYTSFMPPYDVRLFHGINKHHDIPFNESLHDALLAAHEAVDDLKAKEKAIIELKALRGSEVIKPKEVRAFTKEEKIAFRKDWDDRVDRGSSGSSEV